MANTPNEHPSSPEKCACSEASGRELTGHRKVLEPDTMERFFRWSRRIAFDIDNTHSKSRFYQRFRFAYNPDIIAGCRQNMHTYIDGLLERGIIFGS